MIFLIIGWSLLKAGYSSQAGKAVGMEQAIDTLSGFMVTAVALGLLLFGVFSFVEARHRRINDPQVLERLKASVR